MDDPRLTPARPDLAAKYLEGKIAAARFVVGEEFEVADALAPLRSEPSSEAMLLTQTLKGERVTIYDRNGEGWAWGQLSSDGYVGWLPDRALAKPKAAPTHKITALRTFAFPGPSIKLPPLDALLMGATITVVREDGAFAVTRRISATSITLNAILSALPSNSSARPICGAARPASVSIVPASCRWH
jgi:Bacterial dipeptidyl-peptidase Sh3 domain